MSPLPLDGEQASCAQILFSHGAQVHGGELCSAAHLGLPLCVDFFCSLPNFSSDAPDIFFPQWALARGCLARPEPGMSLACAAALDGLDPACGLSIALRSPSTRDISHAKAFIALGRMDFALAFLKDRPSMAQVALEAAMSRPEPSNVPGMESDERALIELAFRLGANPNHNSGDSSAKDFFTPFENAARHARIDLITLCNELEKPTPERLARAIWLASRLGSGLGSPNALSHTLARLDSLALEDAIRSGTVAPSSRPRSRL